MHGFLAGGRLRYQLHVRFRAGQQADAFAQERMVIYCKNPNRCLIRHYVSLFGAAGRKRRPSLAHQPLLVEDFS